MLSCSHFRVQLTLFNLFYLSFVYSAIVYNGFNQGSSFSKNLSGTFQLFNSYNSLCVVSNSADVLTIILSHEIVNKPTIIWNVMEDNINYESLCDCMVILDIDVSKLCKHFVSNNNSKQPLYLFNFGQNHNISYLEKCLFDSWSSEVVVVAVNYGLLFELSPVYPTPRIFSVSNVSQVLRHRRRDVIDLSGAVLTAATMNYTPFTIIKNIDDQDEYDGLEVMLFRLLCQKLNFTLKRDIYKSWGRFQANGSWVGEIMQAMQDGKADVGIASLWQTPQFYNVFDFGPSLNTMKLAFLTRRPKVITEGKWNSLFDIFSLNIWLITFAFFVLVVILYSVGVPLRLKNRIDWTLSILTVFGISLVTTSSNPANRSDTIRFTLVGWSLFSLLLVSSLTSGFVTRLTIPRYTQRLDTVKQLVQGGYTWLYTGYNRFRAGGLVDAFFDVEDYWEAQFEKSYRDLQREEVGLCVDLDNKLTIMVQTFGDLVNAYNAGNISQRALRDFRLSKVKTNIKHVSFGVRKNSPVLETLTRTTLRFQELGLPRQWRDQVLRRWPAYDTRHVFVELDVPTFSEPLPISFDRLHSVFYGLIIGLIIASIVFLFEINFYG